MRVKLSGLDGAARDLAGDDTGDAVALDDGDRHRARCEQICRRALFVWQSSKHGATDSATRGRRQNALATAYETDTAERRQHGVLGPTKSVKLVIPPANTFFDDVQCPHGRFVSKRQDYVGGADLECI
jgi:hypothetical protein